FPFNRSMWAAQEADVGSVYRLITPDLRGFGETAAPDGAYPVDDMADDVVELLDALQIREPMVLGGLSMGGYVALSLALGYPARFRALVLMDTRASADTPDAAANREAQARQVEETGSVAPVVDAMLPRLFSPLTRARHAERIDRLHAGMVK